jgi:2-(1,2-epoxy-1,2-dihydrophenyl)acetyl-CoA isomerase
MSYAHVLVDEGPITTITMNRPERHNAINTEAGDELVDAFTRAGRSPAVKVIVLSGAGRSFCSGDDRSEGAGGQIPDFPWKNPYHSPDIEPFAVYRHGYFQLLSIIRRVPQLVIARIQGYCVGSGIDLMLAADFAIADREARIQPIFGARGIGPAGTVYLPKYVGLKRSMDLLFNPKPISGVDAEQLGLVTKAVELDELDREVDALAQRLLATGEQYYGYFGSVKEAVNRSIFPALDEDVRAQVLSTRLSDFFRFTHPAATVPTD